MYSSYSNVNISYLIRPKIVPVAKNTKKATRDDWRYENLMRTSRGEAMLSYEQFVSQVDAGIIKI